MHCPFCQHNDTKVLDSRVAEDGCSIRRRRCCQSCEQRFTTLELMQLTVVKRSGATEAFDRDKAIAGVRKACKGRPLTEDDLARLGHVVEDTLRGSGQAEFASHEVGMAILEPLRELDEVAYLRFAAVYKQFESAEDFEIEIASLRKHRAEQLAAILETALDSQPRTTHLSPQRLTHRPPGTSWGSGVPGDPLRHHSPSLQECRCQQQD